MRFRVASAAIVLGLTALGQPLASASVQANTAVPLVKRVLLGAHVPPSPYTGMAAFNNLERLTGRLDIVHVFQQWSGGTAAFHRSWLDSARSGGRTVLLTWEPWDPARGANQPNFRPARIAAGAFDSYIRSWAASLKAFGSTVYLRPMHEMNGTWYPWGGTVMGNTPAQYIAAWRRMHTLFAQVGARNVKWVWSPTNEDVPATNRMESFYPGSAYVDVLAMDGYNWGSGYPAYGGWRTFDQVFATAYARISRLGPQPIWVAETASSPTGGNKADWVRQMLSSTGYPRLRAIVWFNVNKEQDWRLNSPTAAASLVAQLRAKPAPFSGARLFR